MGFAFVDGTAEMVSVYSNGFFPARPTGFCGPDAAETGTRADTMGIKTLAFTKSIFC